MLCLDNRGLCLVSKSECPARGGYCHTDLESCREINCLRDVCGFFGGYGDVLAAQLYLGMKVERYTGRLSVILIYFFSGVGGLLVSVCVCTQRFVSVDVSGASSRFMATNRSHTV